jgi:hypothetical protein
LRGSENSPVSRVIWAESGSAAPLEHWVNEHVGGRREMVNHPWTGLRAGLGLPRMR